MRLLQKDLAFGLKIYSQCLADLVEAADKDLTVTVEVAIQRLENTKQFIG